MEFGIDVLVRNLVLVVSLVAMGVAFLVDFLVPAVAGFIFYGLLLWLVAGFFIYRLPVMSRSVGTAPAPRPAPFLPPAPTPAFGPGSSPPVDLGFCMFCGTNLEPGTPQCPTCGHALAPV
ncbi:MAG: hypothetical protein ACREDK_05805 [Thermoplasmata archaeon]